MLREVVLDNDPDCVSDVVDVLLQVMESVGDESATFPLRLGLHEMLLNAIEHGNLEISADEKQRAIETDQYDRLLADRRDDPRYADRRVCVRVMRDHERGVYRCRIRDEGKGFQWREWVARRPECGEGDRPCWRGIALTRNATETMTYNHAGNEVTLTVRVGE